MIVIATTTKNK